MPGETNKPDSKRPANRPRRGKRAAAALTVTSTNSSGPPRPPGISPALGSLIEIIARAASREMKARSASETDAGDAPSAATNQPLPTFVPCDPIADFRVLQRYSGLRQPAAIKRWLLKNGVPFMVQPDGKPVSTLDAIKRALNGGKGLSEPDWSPLPGARQRSSSLRRSR